MAVSEADIAFVRDLFAGLGALETRKMMGGLCIYHEGTLFAILTGEGRVFLKASGRFADRLESLGGEPWITTRKNGQQTAMPYRSLPAPALDDPEDATALAREALAAQIAG